jgi:transposase
VILFIDSTWFTELPPLRAMWAPIGEQACVPITGEHEDRRTLVGVLNIKTGDYLQYVSAHFNQTDFQAVLHLMRAHWRGWHLVLFLDKHPAHRAKASRQLARELSIQLRWLPTACSELNPVDHLWRPVKQDVAANEGTPRLDATVTNAWKYLERMSPRERLRKAGVLSDSFWLKDVLEELG